MTDVEDLVDYGDSDLNTDHDETSIPKLEEGTIDRSPTKTEIRRHERHTVECDAEEQKGNSSAMATMCGLQRSEYPNRDSDTLVSWNRHASPRAQSTQRRCSYINTLSGCRWGSGCRFSHRAEGIRCSSRVPRWNCPRGRRCAFEHPNDRHNSWRPQFSGALTRPALGDMRRWHPNHDKSYPGRRHSPNAIGQHGIPGQGHGTTRVSKTKR
jgi:hypothetical protein